MSNKNSLKDKIKKPNATQAFFNSYETENNMNKNKDANENDIKNNSTKDDEINSIDNNHKDNTNASDNKTYVNNNNIVDVNNEDTNDDDYLRSLASGKKTKKKKPKVFTSFYMEPELAAEVDKIAARGEKGVKSKLINTAIRKLLEEYGVLEKK